MLNNLPFKSWRPSSDDLDLLLWWLVQKPFGSLQHRVARRVLSQMHWEELNALALAQHQSVALAIVKVSVALQSEQSSAGLIESSKRQVMRLASSDTEEGKFSRWANHVLSRLRLHSCDRLVFSYRKKYCVLGFKLHAAILGRMRYV